MEERKKNLVTIRMNDEDKETLDYLSERMDRSMTDTIMRACKFFSSSGYGVQDGVDIREGKRKNRYVHMRVTDSDKTFLDDQCRENGENVSQLVRKSIKAYYNSLKGY